MKFLILSDSHGRLTNSVKTIDKLKDKVSAVLHLGDYVTDAEQLSNMYPSLEFHYVSGNCDGDSRVPDSKIIEYGEVRIFMAHGHRYHVKLDYAQIAKKSKDVGARAALFGHTHAPFSAEVDGVIVANPGSVEFPRGSKRAPSYGVLEITDLGTVEINIVYVT